jgi:endonuclease I
VTFSYDRARDSLFAAVFYDDGAVRCAYTGWPIEIDRASPLAPRTQAFEQGVNTEHSWPQSLGAGEGDPRADLHHLFPTRADANSSRGNLPFAAVAEPVVSRWWYLDTNLTYPPDAPNARWSRTSSSLRAFEPRDDAKGPVARAIFYFRTVYPDEARGTDPLFFDIQKEVLYDWHTAFPPDSLEYARNMLIASFQGGAINPFITDTSLARRAYFSQPSPAEVTFDAIYTFEGTTSCQEEVLDPAVQPVFALLAPFYRSSVLCNQGTNILNSRGWPTGAHLDGDAFVEFTVRAEDGRALVFTYPDRLEFSSRRSATGPAAASVRIRTEHDNEFTTVYSWEPGTGASREPVLLPELADVTTLTVRFYGWNASSEAGTMRLNDMRLTGRTRARTAVTDATSRPAGAPVAVTSVYPNPARGQAAVAFSLSEPGPATLTVYDLLGRRIATLADGMYPAGEHRVTFDAGALPGGVHVVRLAARGAAVGARFVVAP